MVSPLIEANGKSFSIEDLLAHAALDESAHLVCCRPPVPLRSPYKFELAKVVGRHVDSIDLRCSGKLGMEDSVAGEQQ